jgi:DNA-binding transcriptional ArsR family regulator
VDDDRVFRALGDRHRRELLDALFGGDGRTLGELCEVLPEMTRFGVMKHLTVLAEAGLVTTHRAGRSKLHYLNPVPIRDIHDRWISKYAAVTVEAMVGLRRVAEHGAETA